MKTVWKRRGVAAAVLLLVCGAVYMNWRYSDGVKDNKVLGQSELVNANEETAGDPAPAEDDYFATARLSRKQARDNAIHMLQEAESDENAEESVLNEASRTLQVLASYTVAESQIESSGDGQGLRRLRGVHGGGQRQRGGGGSGDGTEHGGRGPHQGHCGQRDGLHPGADQDHGGKLVVVFSRCRWYNTNDSNIPKERE